ncbi:MAG: hypothetical protein D6706_07855 [Chloroflexi bacterium]|nr:MAG: hypothetical protein D6706_07855 [Chloroflexota bacterium]
MRRMFVFLLLGLFLGPVTAVLAFPVPPLPDGNLITNPWFRSAQNPNRPGLDGWTDAAGPNTYWSTSQKDSNPSPDNVTGTAARFASGSGQGGGTGQGGVDAFLYQVVAADPNKRLLRFKTHWVTGWIERAGVTIYGSDAPDGPWTAVWTPLEVTQATSSGMVWTETPLLEQVIERGYAYYKVELFGRYPEGRRQGVKFTGVYFSVGEAIAVTELPAVPVGTPERVPASTPEPTLLPTETATSVPTATVTPMQLPAETAVLPTNTPVLTPTAPATPITASPPTQTSQIGWLPWALLLVFVLIIIGFGWLRRRS